MNNQTYSKEVEIETAICAFDGYPYAFWDLVSVYNPSLGEWVRVSKKNLENYKLKNNVMEKECHECKESFSEESELLICERCDNYFCEDCQAEYNQFTQIDYDCCKSCGQGWDKED